MEWYTFDKNNQKLYFMFLMYTQKKFAIEVLPRVELTHPALTQASNITKYTITI